MISGYRIEEWNGDDIRHRVMASELVATDVITNDAANTAETIHPWKARRPLRGLESQIINEKAERTEYGTCGRFGSTRVRGFYGYFLEKGWEGALHAELARPFLRPAGDAVFPHYADKLREVFNLSRGM